MSTPTTLPPSSNPDHPTVSVACAIIVRDGRVLAARRAYGDYAGWWEFPGGKVEPGETWEAALHREIREELSVELTTIEPFYDFTHDYPKFTAVLRFWLCAVAPDADFATHPDHDDLRWLAPTSDELYSVNWLKGDDGVLDKLCATPLPNDKEGK